jgi:hypothetical protein
LKLNYDELLSNFDFNFNFRHCTTATPQYNLGMKALPRHIAECLDEEAPDAADTLHNVRAEMEGVVQCGVSPEQTQRLEETREAARPLMAAAAGRAAGGAASGGSGGGGDGVPAGPVVGRRAAS